MYLVVDKVYYQLVTFYRCKLEKLLISLGFLNLVALVLSTRESIDKILNNKFMTISRLHIPVQSC